MKKISANDLANIARGAAFLGSGGGGDTSILYQFAYNHLLHKSLELRSVADLTQNDLVIPIAYVGSPAVSKATGPTEAMFLNNIAVVRQKYPCKNIVLMPAEIGGCNALTPIVPAALLNLPLLDADLLGRAFPKVKMCKPGVLRENEKIEFYMASRAGETQSGFVNGVDALENEVRKIAVSFGGSACMATYLFPGNNYQEYVIEGSLSRAYRLGIEKENTGLNLVSAGEIKNIQIENAGGFLLGFVEVAKNEQSYRVYCLNEFYSVESEGERLAASPDIISLVDVETHMPVASESLALGMRVNINVLPAPDFWQEEKARGLVTPERFTL